MKGTAVSNTRKDAQTRTTPDLTAERLDQLAPTLPGIVRQAMRETLPHRYTPALADEITTRTIANLTSDTAVPCPAYRDCADTTVGHHDHFAHDLKVLDDHDGSTILDAGMVSSSDRAIVYIRNSEFTDPGAVHAKTAELRAFLDEVDALADRVLATQPNTRCPAAHPEDPTPCDGPPVVVVLDTDHAGARGCEHHAARLLASLDGGRVHRLPDAPDGAATRTFKAAASLRPFCWTERGEDR